MFLIGDFGSPCSLAAVALTFVVCHSERRIRVIPCYVLELVGSLKRKIEGQTTGSVQRNMKRYIYLQMETVDRNWYVNGEGGHGLGRCLQWCHISFVWSFYPFSFMQSSVISERGGTGPSHRSMLQCWEDGCRRNT